MEKIEHFDILGGVSKYMLKLLSEIYILLLGLNVMP